MRVIEFGVIKELQIPDSWSRFDYSGMRSTSIVFRITSEPLVEIVLLENGRTISDESASLFKKLVSDASGTFYNKHSTASTEIRELFKTLASSLDSTLVGDNQLVADVPNSKTLSENYRNPAFELEEARVENLNGKNVIAIDGFFRRLDENAQPMVNKMGESAKKYYCGIFFEASQERAKIDELYLTCDDANLFEQSKSTFSAFLGTLKWR